MAGDKSEEFLPPDGDPPLEGNESSKSDEDWAAPPVGKEPKKKKSFFGGDKKKKEENEEKPVPAAPSENAAQPESPSEIPESQPGSLASAPSEQHETGPSERVRIKPPSRIFKTLKILLILAFLGAIAAFAAKKFLFKKKDTAPKVSLEDAVAKEQKKEEGPIPVKGFKVGRFNFEDSLNALGTIKGSVEFKLSFEVPGTISSINYREGERYEEGALLISLRQDDVLLRLKRAQAELNKAQTQTKIAGEKVKEHKKLLKLGAISKTALENAKLEHESASYEAEAARLEVKANEAMLEKSNLYAPSAGMIGELNVEEGETVTPNTLLGTHISTEFVYAEFGVVERDVNKIALGQKARVFVDAYPDKTFEGVIENIAPVVAGTSRTASAKVRVENPDRLLLPGMFTRIRILLYSKKNTLVIPTDSIQGGEGEQFIYVLHSQKESEQPSEAGSEKSQTEGADKKDVQAGSKGKEISPEKPPEPPTVKKDEKSGKTSEGEEAAPEAQEKIDKAKEVQTVEKRAITVGYTRPDYSQVDAGISEGEVIAITGLERLEDGKKVKLLEVQEAEV